MNQRFVEPEHSEVVCVLQEFIADNEMKTTDNLGIISILTQRVDKKILKKIGEKDGKKISLFGDCINKHQFIRQLGRSRRKFYKKNV
ncbi:MAG: hypothetical protein H8E57_01975 [Candidatus Cloacimonetes bacterium]|nr:hypothetical protein [Candidatus Cloacimonadota bacterium]